MRIKILIIFFTFSITLFAATQVWTYDRSSDPDGAAIIQIIGDGKGGCGTVWMDTNDVINVVWLDKKGNVKYEQQFYGFVLSPNVIIGCSKKQLVYFSGIPLPMVVQVDSKGNAKVTGTLGGYLTGLVTLPLPRQKLVDKKGFFAVNADTNDIYQTLVRYSHK